MFTHTAHGQTKINPEPIPEDFIGWWIPRSYLTNLVEKNNPKNIIPGEMLCIYPQFKAMIISGNEGWNQSIKVINTKELHILNDLNNVEYIIRRTSTLTGTEILIKDETGGDSGIKRFNERFVRYPLKYEEKPPVEIINDLIFAGEYLTYNQGNREVIFKADGTVTGIKNYTHYEIDLFWSSLFNMIYFRKGNKHSKDYTVYHYEFPGDTLKLYYSVPSQYEHEYDKGELFLKLIKKSK